MALVVLMPREGFYIIRCPKCGHYTYAPTRQKTRLCVYCQRIFKINPLSAVFVENAETARTRVKLYQTGKHHKDFLEAMEKSRSKIQQLIPDNDMDLEQLQDNRHEIQPVSARRRELEQVLYRCARLKPLDLHVLEKECLKVGLSWEWVVQQIENLIRSGHLISPKPWQVRLVTDEIQPTKQRGKQVSPTQLARTIGNILRKSKKPLRQEELVSQLQNEAVSSTGIEEALNLLRNQGYVLKTSKGTYQWTGD